MTIIEMLIAVGVCSLVAIGATLIFRTMQSESAGHAARAAVQDDTTALEARVRKVFAARASYTMPAAGALQITRHGRDTDYNSLYTVDIETQCQPLPATANLPGAEQATLANLGTCVPCPVGQVPIVTVTDSETGAVQTFPGGAQAPGVTQRPIAGAFCPTPAGSGVSVDVGMGIVRPSTPRAAAVFHHQLFLKTQNAAGGVQILH